MRIFPKKYKHRCPAKVQLNPNILDCSNYQEPCLLDLVLMKLGLVRKAWVDDTLMFARHVNKRLDEHREVVESLSQTDFFVQHWWHSDHLATQDDYLMKLFYVVHGEWPEPSNQYKFKVRARPDILGQCKLKEYRQNVTIN